MVQGARTAKVVCSPGLEGLLLAELEELGVQARQTDGGCLVDATSAALGKVESGSFCADRVQIRLGRIPASSLDALATGVRSLPWREIVDPRQEIHVVVRGRGKHLHRGPVVVRKVSHAIQDAVRGPRGVLSGRPPDPLDVWLEVEGVKATVWVDASGSPLHRRGWRPESVKAPLRETVASALLRAAGWTPGVPLLDPMCGAGTFAIEAARRAQGLTPRLRPEGAWRRWSMFRDAKRAGGVAARPVPTRIWASDRDPGAFHATTRNAARAGVAGHIEISHAHFSDLAPPAPSGLLIANPPWGRRLASQQVLRKLASSWGSSLPAWSGWTVAWIVPDPELFRLMGGGFESTVSFRHGGVPVVLGVRSA